jgi:hypothetical protein
MLAADAIATRELHKRNDSGADSPLKQDQLILEHFRVLTLLITLRLSC